MDNQFFEQPILNSPYEYPAGIGNSMSRASRRSRLSRAAAAPSSSRQFPSRESARQKADQQQIVFDEGKGLSTEKQQYDPTSDHQ